MLVLSLDTLGSFYAFLVPKIGSLEFFYCFSDILDEKSENCPNYIPIISVITELSYFSDKDNSALAFALEPA